MQNFAGESTTPYAQARAWRARIAPTILFMDYDGREVVDRLEGMTVADFYGQYLTQRIEDARRSVRRA